MQIDQLKEMDRNLSQCLIDAQLVTKNDDLLEFIAFRNDVKQTREYAFQDNKCIITYKFHVVSSKDNSVSKISLNKEELEKLEKKIQLTSYYIFMILQKMKIFLIC